MLPHSIFCSHGNRVSSIETIFNLPPSGAKQNFLSALLKKLDFYVYSCKMASQKFCKWPYCATPAQVKFMLPTVYFMSMSSSFSGPVLSEFILSENRFKIFCNHKGGAAPLANKNIFFIKEHILLCVHMYEPSEFHNVKIFLLARFKVWKSFLPKKQLKS